MNKRYLHLAAALAMAAALGACGGDDDDGPAAQTPGTPTSGVPSSAQQSVAGLITYLTQLVGQSSDTGEPLLLGDAVLPTSDTEEASALN